MSNCHEEHSHTHDHSEGAAHDHTDDITPALQNQIYAQIDFDAITTLNESEPGSGAGILKKTWLERADGTPELVSDVDEQLLMHVPFTAQLRLHTILILTSSSPSAPQTLHLFANSTTPLDFSAASDLAPTQTIHLSQTSTLQEIPIKRALFSTLRTLDLFFEDNFGNGEEETTRIGYIGFKGEWMKLNREPVQVLYESAANPKDHVLPTGVGESMGSGIGGAGGRDGV